MSGPEGGAPTAADVAPVKEHPVDNGFAREVATKRLAKKETAVRNKLLADDTLQPGDLPPSEKAVYSRSALALGLKAGNPNFNYGTDGIALKFFNANEADETLTIEPGGTESPFNISVITGEVTADGSLFYVCTTPGGEDKRVRAEVLVDAYSKQNADELGNAFLTGPRPDQDQADLVAWSSRNDGSDCPVDIDVVTAIDAADSVDTESSMKEVDMFISAQITVLQKEIAQLRDNPNRGAQETNRLDQLQGVLAECQRATLMEGSGGVFYKEHVLRKLRPLQITQGDQGRVLAEQIDVQLGNIIDSGALAHAEDDLVELLNEKLPKEQADRYNELMKKVFDEHKGLEVLHERDVATLEGINTLVFGSEEMTNNVVNTLLGNPDVTGKARLMLKSLKDNGPTAGISLLEILLLLSGELINAGLEAMKNASPR